MMKIEMGESLIYSWLRHEKQCQLVQTNWKPSYYWNIDGNDGLQALANNFRQYYRETHNYDIIKGRSLWQFIKQAEIDAVGIALSESAHRIFAVDIAYHEAGLNYGDKEKTVSKIIQKCVRTILCVYGYFNVTAGEVVFASPKIGPAIERELNPLFEELNRFIGTLGLGFTASLYCNDAFSAEIVQPILAKGTKVADTSEMFLRSIQLYQMFTPPSIHATAPIHPAKIDNATQPMKEKEHLT